MKIAIWWEQTSWGGVDTHLVNLLANWPMKSDSFFIFSNKDNEGLDRTEKMLLSLGNITFIRFNRALVFKNRIFKVAAYLLLPVRFLFYIIHNYFLLNNNGNFDVVIVNQGGYPGSWGGLACLFASKLSRVQRVILLVHHCAVGRKPLRHTFETLLDLGVQIYSTDIIAVSRATRKTLIDRRDFDVEGYPIRVIHNGVNMPGQIDSDGGNKSNWLKNELKIPLESSFLLGIVGRVERYKGHEDLIVGLSMLSMSERERVFVVVVGAGSAVEVERLNDLAHALGVKNNLRILGYFNEPIERLLVELDMLVMLTKDFEGFGFTVAESMALGTPVIATNVGAVNEFFNNSVGYMIEPESPIMIAQSILRAMHNPDELNKKIQAARIQIQQFDAITMAKNFHRILLVGA